MDNDILNVCCRRRSNRVSATVSLAEDSCERTASNYWIGIRRREAVRSFWISAKSDASLLIGEIHALDYISGADIEHIYRVEVYVRHDIDLHTNLFSMEDITVLDANILWKHDCNRKSSVMVEHTVLNCAEDNINSFSLWVFKS